MESENAKFLIFFYLSFIFYLLMLPIVFRKVDLSFEQLGQWRRKGADVSISLSQLQIELSESWKLCLNLYSQRWFKPSVNLVNSLIPLGVFLKMLNFLNCEYFDPICSIELLLKEKRNFERNYALLWIEKY